MATPFTLYGYADADNSGLVVLREASIVLSPATARVLAAFLLKCADEMERDPLWEHEHFNGGQSVDIVVVNKEFAEAQMIGSNGPLADLPSKPDGVIKAK